MKKVVEKAVGGIFYACGAISAFALGVFYSIPMSVKTIKTAVRMARDEGRSNTREPVERAWTIVREEYSDKMDKVLGLK